MKTSAFIFAAAALLLSAGCGHEGATQFAGAEPTPNAESTFGQCAFCHDTIATNMVVTGGHHDLSIKCEFCHTDLTPGEVGPGHRSVPACADCHTEQMTHHDPEAGTASACTICHTPHGSTNLYLIQENLTTSGDVVHTVPIQFTNLAGRADGSFASVSDPGTGLCEVCHTTTMFYRSDGTGDDHFPYPCFTCHRHATSFRPN